MAMERMPRLANFFHQRLQAGVDILHPALAAPMPLGREVDDELRIAQQVPVSNTNILPGCTSSACAGGFIRLEVRRESVLELKRDAAAHDADAIDRIDERFRVRLEDVAGREFDHRHLPSVVPFSSYFDPRPMRGALHGAWRPSARWPANSTPMRSTKCQGKACSIRNSACLPSLIRRETCRRD